jgi:hypothetical protein
MMGCLGGCISRGRGLSQDCATLAQQPLFTKITQSGIISHFTYTPALALKFVCSVSAVERSILDNRVYSNSTKDCGDAYPCIRVTETEALVSREVMYLNSKSNAFCADNQLY